MVFWNLCVEIEQGSLRVNSRWVSGMISSLFQTIDHTFTFWAIAEEEHQGFYQIFCCFVDFPAKKYQASKLKTTVEILNINNTSDFTWTPCYLQGKTTGQLQLLSFINLEEPLQICTMQIQWAVPFYTKIGKFQRTMVHLKNSLSRDSIY